MSESACHMNASIGRLLAYVSKPSSVWAQPTVLTLPTLCGSHGNRFDVILLQVVMNEQSLAMDFRTVRSFVALSCIRGSHE